MNTSELARDTVRKVNQLASIELGRIFGTQADKELEQIILAAIHEALKVEWVDEPPTTAGWYWFRERLCPPMAVQVS